MSEAFPVVEGLLNIKTKFCLYTFRFLSGVSFATFRELSTWNLFFCFNKFTKYSIHLFSYQYLAI